MVNQIPSDYKTTPINMETVNSLFTPVNVVDVLYRWHSTDTWLTNSSKVWILQHDWIHAGNYSWVFNLFTNYQNQECSRHGNDAVDGRWSVAPATGDDQSCFDYQDEAWQVEKRV